MSLTAWYERHQRKVMLGAFVAFTVVMLYVMHPSWFI